MKNKVLAVALAAVMLLCAAPVSASAATDITAVTDTLAATGVMQGDDTGSLNLSSYVTRAEFAKMAVCASEYKDSVATSVSSSLFSDVRYTHWAAPYVKVAASAGYVSGYTDGSFKPDRTITLSETVSVVLRMLGYSSADYTQPFPEGALLLYHKLGLDENISKSGSDSMTRQDCAYLFYNALNTTTKTGAVYCTTLGYAVGSDGKINYTGVMSAAMKGPVIVTDAAWTASIKNYSSATIYRNNEKASLSDISLYDVLYYSDSPSVIWAYASRVSGEVEQISPDRTTPTSVKVAGTVYQLDSASQAPTQFSMYGSFKAGDSVTLLLGKDGAVEYAVSTDAVSEAVCGVLVSTGTTTLTNAAGYEYQTDSATVVTTDGQQYTYPVTCKLDEGTVVSISFTAQGTSISKETSKSLTGTVSSDGKTLGGKTFADDVQILDWNDDGYCTVTTGRLAGTVLSSGMIKYVAYDGDGKISHLILNDVTGDMYSYGILTQIVAQYTDNGKVKTEYPSDLSSRSEAMTASGITYSYLVGGVSSQGMNSSKIFPVSTGPVAITASGATINSIQSLQKTTVTAITDGTVKGSGGTFKTGTNLQVYLYDGSYYTSSLEIVNDTSKYTLTGYYDKADAKGGRLRVLVAVAK